MEQQILLHPAGFRKVFPDRYVNNVYYDTADFRAFQENVSGVGSRRKYRLRWYGPPSAHQQALTLEIKVKENELGYKISRTLPGTTWGKLQQLARLTPGVTPLSLRAVLVNRYQRSYYGTSDGRFRITLDWGQQFQAYRSTYRSTFPRSSADIIVELKYAEAQEKRAPAIWQLLPFRQTKNSKYVFGVILTLA